MTPIKRTRHAAIFGRTGSGKSTFLLYLAWQDIRSRLGFVHFDFHGDSTETLLRLVAEEEARTGEDLSGRLIVIAPGDLERTVGLNILAGLDPSRRFLQVSEFAQILKDRWGLSNFGARTEELLRNSLHALAESGLTLLELEPLLTENAFRARVLRDCGNAEARAYFERRFDSASPQMQAVMREPILNKTSAFCSDPRFRHIVGQRRSTFDLREAIDSGAWILLRLDKGRLGPEVFTLAGLFLSKLKSALFSRRTRDLFTLHLDEVQNLVSVDSGLDTLLSEARKFGVSVMTANQYLEQHSAKMRSSLLAVGTHLLFQLSPPDASAIAAVLGAPKSLRDRLINLPQRRLIAKLGQDRPLEIEVPFFQSRDYDPADLLSRSNARWTRPRTEVEAHIRDRALEARRNQDEALDGWE